MNFKTKRKKQEKKKKLNQCLARTFVLEKILLPVLEVIEDPEISNMILKIMCEAWLDYIYLHRIKFR